MEVDREISVLVNAKIYPLRPFNNGAGPLSHRQLEPPNFNEHCVESLWAENGRVMAVGDRDSVFQSYESAHGSPPPAAAVVDMNGKAVLPGFIDAHIHVGLLAEKSARLNMTPCRTTDEMTGAVAHAIAAGSAGPTGWLLGEGWDQERSPSRVYPNALDIDEVSGGTPVLLWRCCYHVALANTKCMQMLNIVDASGNLTPEWAPTEAGSADVDPTTGKPTGVLREAHAEKAFKGAPKVPMEVRKANTLKALLDLASTGITSVQTNDEFLPMPVYTALAGDHSGRLPCRVYLTPVWGESKPLFDQGVRTGDSVNEYLKWGRIKLFADGALGAATAALRDPYVEKSCERCRSHKGMLRISAEELKRNCKALHDAGWQAEIHVIGDAAAEAAITALEGAGERRHVLTHCQVMGEDLIKRMSAGNMIGNIQPVFLRTDLHWAEDRLGPERCKYSYAWRTMMQEGAVCAGGSDAPVEDAAPLIGIYTAIARADMDGVPTGGWYPGEKLTLPEALRLFTHGGAYAEFSEGSKGSLVPGMLADMVVLDADPFEKVAAEGPRGLLALRVVATLVGGRVVYATL